MALEGQESIVAAHPMTVITHPDEPTPGPLHGDCDRVRRGVKSILRQFFDHGGRTLDHLACGDAVGQILR